MAMYRSEKMTVIFGIWVFSEEIVESKKETFLTSDPKERKHIMQSIEWQMLGRPLTLFKVLWLMGLGELISGIDL